MPRQDAQFERLRRLIAEGQKRQQQGGAGRPIPLKVGDFDTQQKNDTFDFRKPQHWRDALSSLESIFPHSIRVTRPSVSDRQAKMEFSRFYECGEVHCTWTQGKQTFHIYLAINEDPAPAGCSCADSDGVEPCCHSLWLLRYLVQQLRTDRELCRRIVEGQIESGEPPHELFRSDPSSMALTQLDELVEKSEQIRLAFDEPDEETLPAVEEQVQRRVAWDLSESSGGYLSIQPILQQQRKRGGGYTKGKKLSLAKLFTESGLPLSDADKRVVSGIERSESHYFNAADYMLEPFAAIEALLDQPNVLLEGEPVEISRCNHYLTVGARQDSYRVVFTDETGTEIYPRVIASNDAFLRIDGEGNRIFVGKSSAQEAELIRSLCQLPPVDASRREDLVASLTHLQRRISILLPPDLAGEVSVEPARPAILLRSHPEGRLDFGIRIRDAAGTLRSPLKGPMVVPVTRDGEAVQVVRSTDQESKMVQRLLDRWGLDVDPETWFGSIEDFSDGLRLIESLQSSDSEVEVLWDRNCEKPVTVLGRLSSKNVKVNITNKRNWFGISGECEFDGQTIALEDLIRGLPDDEQEGIGDYIKLADGQWAKISAGLRRRLKRLQAATHQDRTTLKLDATAAPAVRDLLEDEVALKASRAWQQCAARLERAEHLDPQLPDSLDADLRDYQVDGFKWLRKLSEWGVGGILADDMGLGKTLQTLAVLVDRAKLGPALVIAPTSVGFNWVREAERFAPDLDVHLYRETERANFLPTVSTGSLVICSYGLALKDAEALSSLEWSTLVLDEAQAIKNSRSKTSKAIAQLPADWTVALTGTPVENHLGELWSLFHVVSPGVFGGWEHFRRRFAAPIEKEGSDAARQSLAHRLQPFVLRRTKGEVLSELPPRTEMNLYVDLNEDERAEYERVRRTALGEIEDIEELENVQDRRFKILAVMTRLRQIACHAGLVNRDWKGTSAKLDQLCQTLESLRSEGHRALIFSQFTSHLGLIRDALDARGFGYEYLDGGTAAKARQEAVDRFQSGDADAFLISLKAGGTGLNLTAADYVIHMDPWWNPAVEDQATDRAHRMGQEKPVMVYRIIARGTIEEEILALHESKRDLVSGVMQGTQAAAKLSNEDLIRMLRSK